MASSSFRTVVRTIVGVLLLVTVLLGVYDSYVCTTAVAVPSSSTVKNSIISANLSSVSSSLSSSFTTTTTENLPHVRNDPNNAGTCTATTATMTMTTAVHYHWHPVDFVTTFRDCLHHPPPPLPPKYTNRVAIRTWYDAFRPILWTFATTRNFPLIKYPVPNTNGSSKPVLIWPC